MTGAPQPGDEPGDEDRPSAPGPGAWFGLPFPFAGVEPGSIDPDTLAGLFAPGTVLSWEVARQVAHAVADAAGPEPPLDGSVRREITEIVRAAAVPVAAETGLTAAAGFHPEIWTRRDCADRQLDALRPVLEALAARLRDTLDAEVAAPGADLGVEGLPLGTLLALAPVLLGAQAGAMVGYLAQRTLGRYDLPLPFAGPPGVALVAGNVERFAGEWSLPRSDLLFFLALGELVRAAQRAVRWVREHLVTLAVDAVSAYEFDEAALDDRLGELDPTDPASLARLAEHPLELLGAMTSERQQRCIGEIRRVTAVLEGHVWLVRDRIGWRMLHEAGRLGEAVQRQHLERGEAGRFIEALLGLRLERDDVAQGRAFCAGVAERAGLAALAVLYEDPSRLPTPAELEAPGLWLARIELDGGGVATDVPHPGDG